MPNESLNFFFYFSIRKHTLDVKISVVLLMRYVCSMLIDSILIIHCISFILLLLPSLFYIYKQNELAKIYSFFAKFILFNDFNLSFFFSDDDDDDKNRNQIWHLQLFFLFVFFFWIRSNSQFISVSLILINKLYFLFAAAAYCCHFNFKLL